MHDFREKVFQAALKALSLTKGDKILKPFTQGIGLIFTLHHVCPNRPQDFDPNRILRITPEFLDHAIKQVKEGGFDIVSLDEAHRRLVEREPPSPFACFTLDDGYKDNRDYAYPIFKAHNVPFTLYVPSDYPDGKGQLWWLALQDVIARVDRLEVTMGGARRKFSCRKTDEKIRTYNKVYWGLRSLDPSKFDAFICDFSNRYTVDFKAQCRRLVMDWDQLRTLNQDPLVTIGGHTKTHLPLAKLPADKTRFEIEENRSRLEKELGAPPEHFSYPYGDRASAASREFKMVEDLGFKTAVTTRKGVLYDDHGEHLFALPRVSLNGNFQSDNVVSLYMAGAPFALFNGFQRLDVQ